MSATGSGSLPRRRTLLVGIALVAITLGVYGRAVGHRYVGIDDAVYVTQNARVQEGLTSEGVRWAFTTNHAANWHPVTWLSHMLDAELFGSGPAAPHAVNVVLHALTSLLLFLWLDRATRETWPSATVAALFALHPIQVESVAWIAERKDLLSALFWLLSMWGWLAYARRPSVARYLLVAMLFAAGLLAKPMLVTLPFVFLLLDYWPLGRWPHGGGAEMAGPGPTASPRWLVLEKVPLLLLSVGSSVATVVAQRAGGAVVDLESLPLAARVANALVGYTVYLGKTIWPTGLAVFYPHPATYPIWRVAGAAAILGAISVAAWRWRRRRPWLVLGWCWFLGTLVPVIGLVQVGAQAVADRYTYLPAVGLFIMVAWGLAELVEIRGVRARTRSVLAALLLATLAALTWVQLGHWRDAESLFSHATRVTRDNHVAQYNLGLALARAGRIDEAVDRFSEAARIVPEYAEARHNLGTALLAQGRIEEAAVHLGEARRLSPEVPLAHYNHGRALETLGRSAEAAVAYRDALGLRPEWPGALDRLARLLATAGDERVRDPAEAVRLAETAARLTSSSPRPEVLETLGVAYAADGRLGDAIQVWTQAAELARAAGRDALATRIEASARRYRAGRHEVER
jgi:tetratricopeptide (TPR) repeat protein